MSGALRRKGYPAHFGKAYDEAQDSPVDSPLDSRLLDVLCREIPLRKTRSSISPAHQLSAISKSAGSSDGLGVFLRGIAALVGGIGED